MIKSAEQKWTFIVNPVAGNGKAKDLLSILKEQVAGRGIQGEILTTEKSGHAHELAKEAFDKGSRTIIAVGGDGTFNEIASALFEKDEVRLGIIPAGTGNDFIQILGFPDQFETEHWEVLFSENIKLMDVGICNGLPFFNGMGLGFDAEVAAQNYTEPGEVKKGGKFKYIYHILKTLFFYREKRMTIKTEMREQETDCFINTIAVGRRFAGDFFLTPQALADDGLLDVCMIRRLTLLQRLKILLKVPKGTHIEDKKVNYYQGPEFNLKFSEKVPFHLDGELHFAKEFNVKLIKKSLAVIYNPEGDHYFSSK